jgi:hypothetical protein
MVLAKLYETRLFATHTSTNLTISYVSQNGQRSYPLRPELIESTYWLFKATRDYRCVFLCQVKTELVLCKHINLLDSVALTTRRIDLSGTLYVWFCMGCWWRQKVFTFGLCQLDGWTSGLSFTSAKVISLLWNKLQDRVLLTDTCKLLTIFS